MTNKQKIKVIKKKPQAEAVLEFVNFAETFERQEKSMLKLYMQKYPDAVRRYARELNILLTKDKETS